METTKKTKKAPAKKVAAKSPTKKPGAKKTKDKKFTVTTDAAGNIKKIIEL